MKTPAGQNMPKYRASSELHALKIAAVEKLPDSKCKVTFADNFFHPIEVGEEQMDWPPQAGEYLIAKPDGRYSTAPAEQFEQSFKRVD